MSQPTEPGPPSPAGRGGRVKLVLGVLAAGLLMAGGRYFDLPQHLARALDWVAGQGAVGVAVFIALYVLACVFFVPGSVLTLGAGAVYGVAAGVPITLTAATLGATAAFLAGRYLARDAVARKIEGNVKFKAIDEAVAREGWKIVGLTRLSPVFPFNLLNYAYGLTGVSLRDYFLATFVGMIPGSLMYVYIGSLAGNLATLGTQQSTRTPAQWALYAVGLIATLAVTVYVTRIAKAALAKKV